MKKGDYIKINNDIEFVEVQKYLFSLGYIWCDSTQNIIPKCNYPYPDYILISNNHVDKNGTLMFSYGLVPEESEERIINGCEIVREMREKKMKRIIYDSN